MAGPTDKTCGMTEKEGAMADSDLENPRLDVHVRTYGSVIGMLKWGAVAVAIVAAMVIWLIAH